MLASCKQNIIINVALNTLNTLRCLTNRSLDIERKFALYIYFK